MRHKCQYGRNPERTADDEVCVGQCEFGLHQLARVSCVEHVVDAVGIDAHCSRRAACASVFEGDFNAVRMGIKTLVMESDEITANLIPKVALVAGLLSDIISCKRRRSE